MSPTRPIAWVHIQNSHASVVALYGLGWLLRQPRLVTAMPRHRYHCAVVDVVEMSPASCKLTAGFVCL